MTITARLASGSASLVASLLVLAGHAGPLENAAAQKQVLEMAEKPGDAKLAKAIADNPTFSIEEVMHQFKPRNKGGLGVGPKPVEGSKDGIELLIKDLAADKKGYARDTVGKYSADLVTAAKQTRAIAEINAFYAPKGDKGPKTRADWKKWNDEMKAGAEDLARAAAARDPAAVKAAAEKLDNACVKCHQIFRD